MGLGRSELTEIAQVLRTPLVVPKLDRLARSVPDARHIGDSLVARGIKLSLPRRVPRANLMPGSLASGGTQEIEEKI